MQLKYDQVVDAVYVYFSREQVDRTDEVSVHTNVDYDAAGDPVGIEFLDVSEGIDLDAVPRRDEVAQLLEQVGKFRIYA